MADTNPISDDANKARRELLEKRKKEFEEIAERRSAGIEEQREKVEQKKAAAKESEKLQAEAFQAEVAETRARAEGREDWRQEQHAKREEERKDAIKRAVETQRLEEERKKKEAAAEERKGYMMNLHKMAIARKVRDKRDAIEKEEDREMKTAEDIAGREIHELDEETLRALNHFESDKRRRLDLARMNADHRKRQIEEEAHSHKLDAERKMKDAVEEARHLPNREEAAKRTSTAQMDAGRENMRVERDRRAKLETVESELAKELFNIEQEMEKLKNETTHNAGAKKLIIEHREDQKKKEAERRTENFEKWLKDA